MATTRNNERIRYRYGICLNDNCEKCKSKEVQEIPARKDFVCQNPECGKPLRECPPPKKGVNKKLIAIIAGIVAILAIIVGVILMSGGGEEKGTSVTPVDSDSIKAAQMDAENQLKMAAEQAKKDSLEQARRDSLDQERKDSLEQARRDSLEKAIRDSLEKANKVKTPKPVQTTTGSKDLGYATFKGSWPNDVKGRMVFKSSHVIDSKDPKGRMAEPGDYVIGEWSNGHLVQGIWYSADNQVKGSVIIGK